MKKRSIRNTILFTLGAIVILLSAAIWVFLSFYLERTINSVVLPKIQQAAFQATNGRFALTLGKISYSHGSLVCDSFILSRIAYDSSEHGMGLERIVIDSARFEGIRWWDVLLDNDLKLASLQLNEPKLYIIDIDSDMSVPHHVHFDTSKKNGAEGLILPVISFDSVVLRDISLFLRRSKTFRSRLLSVRSEQDTNLRPIDRTGQPLHRSEYLTFYDGSDRASSLLLFLVPSINRWR